MSHHPKVISIFGPTGSGKTDVAVRVAASLNTEVVNCDPAQCYRGLPTLVNHPTLEHDQIASHRLIAIWGMDFTSSFVQFADAAHEAIDELVSDRGHVVVCGGSGLYMQAALTDLASADAAPLHDRALRAELERRWEDGDQARLYQELAKLDSAVATRTHPHDRPRVVRALEVALLGGSISPEGGSHWDAKHRHDSILVHLQVDRPQVHMRIDERTQRMFDAGVLDEIATLAGSDGSKADVVFSSTARKLHGLEDCLGVLRREHSQEVAIEKMARRTRQYAKRQDTWARRWPGMGSVAASDANFDQIARRILELRM